VSSNIVRSAATAAGVVPDPKFTELASASKRGLPYVLYGRGDMDREAPQWPVGHCDRESHYALDFATTAKNAKRRLPKWATRKAKAAAKTRRGCGTP
jgi:hypothetical protein